MLMPRYYFAEDFRPFQDYFLSQPHTEKTFQKGGLLWEPGRPYEKIHYILSGAAMHYALHESGRRKIISFHGPGTVFPGYRQNGYRIECTLATQALSDMRVLEFTVPQFTAMFVSSPALSRQVVNWYSMYINRFLYETIHQEFNPTRIKLCNLLYKPSFIGLIRKLIYNNNIFICLFFNMSFSSHFHTTTPCAISFYNAFFTINYSTCWKIWTFDKLHNLF